MNYRILEDSTFNTLMNQNEFFDFIDSSTPEIMFRDVTINGESYKDISILIIGKTGYGKSTIANKIVNKDVFPTDNTLSCTKDIDIARYRINGKKNHFFSFYDLPGLGEDLESDEEYYEYYRNMISHCHLTIYVLRADQRDYAIDISIIRDLFQGNIEENTRAILLLNFVDKIEPINRGNSQALSNEQTKNIESKEVELAQMLGIPTHKILGISAKENIKISNLSYFIFLFFNRLILLAESEDLKETYKDFTDWRRTMV